MKNAIEQFMAPQVGFEPTTCRLIPTHRDSTTELSAYAISGSAGRIRTYDPPVNSRLLYH